jgi:hypothetical protein
MSTLVFDCLYIKTIEKEIGYKLDEFDLDALKYGEPIFLKKYNGIWNSYLVPYYQFPYDLMPKVADFAAATQLIGIFRFALTNEYPVGKQNE